MFLKRLKIDLSCDPAILFLGFYTKEMNSIYQRSACPPTLIVAQFTKAKILNQPWCPSTYKWIMKMWHMCTMEYYSAIRNEILSFSEK